MDAALLPQWLQRLSTWHGTDSLHFTVSYQGHRVVNGSELPVAHVETAPEVAYQGSETYTLMLLDPDAPSHERPENRNL